MPSLTGRKRDLLFPASNLVRKGRGGSIGLELGIVEQYDKNHKLIKAD